MTRAPRSVLSGAHSTTTPSEPARPRPARVPPCRRRRAVPALRVHRYGQAGPWPTFVDREPLGALLWPFSSMSTALWLAHTAAESVSFGHQPARFWRCSRERRPYFSGLLLGQRMEHAFSRSSPSCGPSSLDPTARQVFLSARSTARSRLTTSPLILRSCAAGTSFSIALTLAESKRMICAVSQPPSSLKFVPRRLTVGRGSSGVPCSSSLPASPHSRTSERCRSRGPRHRHCPGCLRRCPTGS